MNMKDMHEVLDLMEEVAELLKEEPLSKNTKAIVIMKNIEMLRLADDLDGPVLGIIQSALLKHMDGTLLEAIELGKVSVEMTMNDLASKSATKKQ